jgi:aromatic-L-amino-acid decarboxylase
MNHDDLPHWIGRAADWGHRYHASLRDRPVRAQTRPGEIAAQIAPHPPEASEPMEAIWADFERIVPPGMTHWQHPRFFAYFPANAAPVSMLAEVLTATMAAQCMLWQTSPAATEIEERMVDWLAQALGLPGFTGVIQDSASSATLAAVLTMRERARGWSGNTDGLAGGPTLRIYASAQTHSSVDKAVRVAGIGQSNLVKVPTDVDDAMDPEALRAGIAADRAAGHLPAGVILCVGGTSVGATDPVAACLAVARDHGLYTHVDAAWAGSAMICPELRPLWAGVEGADSIVFNPHKWLGAQFDCAVQFLKDPAPQIRTLGLRPDYLQTAGHDGITDYSEWCVPLGRRFRALKLWFLLRAHGLEGLRTMIRNHIAWAGEVRDAVATLPDVEITSPLRLSLFSFRHAPPRADPDAATAALLQRINDAGRIYLTQTRHRGQYVIRFQIGQFGTTRADALEAVTAIRDAIAQGG